MSSEITIPTLPFETEHFDLIVRNSEYNNAPWYGSYCYAIINKLTGVCEAEGTNYAQAVRALFGFEEVLAEVLEDPDGQLAEAKHIAQALDGPPPEGGTVQ